jgi:hypothetical protein
MHTVRPRDSESLTRERLIDPKIKAAGWSVVPYSDEKPLAAFGARRSVISMVKHAADEAHLIENLTIDLGDFDLLPVFARKGGLSQATRVFAGQLHDLIVQFNEAVAA